MQLDLIFGQPSELKPGTEWLVVGSRKVALQLVRHPRARRYLLRLLPDGSARVTIPRGGSAAEARNFAGRQTAWLEKQRQRLQEKPPVNTDWVAGTQVWFRGETATIQLLSAGYIQLGAETIKTGEATHFRPAIHRHLRQLALRELPPRLAELARQQGVVIARVSIRNQRSRWGSCSRHGNISLNWRLIQLPGFVSDYIMLHELMHRRQLNHSARFWAEVAGVCPEYKKAESWLKQHSALLS